MLLRPPRVTRTDTTLSLHDALPIYADHADLHAAREFARHLAVAREARHAIAELVLVDQFDGARQIRHAHHGQHRPEDFVLVDGHVRRDIVEQRAAGEEAVFVALHLDAATVDDELRAFLDAGIDVAFDLGLVRGADQRAHLGGLVPAGVYHPCW